MDSFISELLKTGGPLGVLVVVVWIFVKVIQYLSSMFTKAMSDQGAEHRAWMAEIDKSHQQNMANLNSQHLAARDATHECINRNTVALDRNSQSMLELAKSVAVCPLKNQDKA